MKQEILGNNYCDFLFSDGVYIRIDNIQISCKIPPFQFAANHNTFSSEFACCVLIVYFALT